MNKKVILKQRPVGEPKLEDFELFKEDIRDPKDDEVSLKNNLYVFRPLHERQNE